MPGCQGGLGSKLQAGRDLQRLQAGEQEQGSRGSVHSRQPVPVLQPLGQRRGLAVHERPDPLACATQCSRYAATDAAARKCGGFDDSARGHLQEDNPGAHGHQGPPTVGCFVHAGLHLHVERSHQGKCVQDPKTGKRYYPKIHVAVLNSLYHGVPQSRTRLYVAAVHAPARDFQWPAPEKDHGNTLENCLDPLVTRRPRPQYPTTKTELSNLLAAFQALRDNELSINDKHAVADIGAGWKGRPAITHGYFPCLLRTRCASNGYWIFSRQRKPHLNEYFRLQGIPPGRLLLPASVSERQMRAMIGNSFTVTTVAAILDRLLFSAGLTTRPLTFQLGTGSDGMVF